MIDLSYQSDDFDDEDQPLNAPHSDEFALTENFDYVTNSLSIRIFKGSYRHAKINDKVFEIGDIEMPFDSHNGVLRVQVKCHWYKWKPKHSYIHVKLDGNWQLLSNHSGEVSRNFRQARLLP
jgi:hypothetical protein